MPEIMSRWVRLAEYHQEKVPVLPLHQPLHYLCFFYYAGEQSLVKTLKIRQRNHAHLTMVLSGIASEPLLQFSFQRPQER